MRHRMSLRSIWIGAIAAAMFAVGIFAARAESTAPTAILPGLIQQVSGGRIGWTFENIGPVLKSAEADSKPVVMVVVAQNCNWCRALLSNALRCPTFNSLAGRAHFVMVDSGIGSSDDAAALVKWLGIRDFPALSVMKVNGKNFSEVVRATGYMDERQLMTILAKTAVGAQNAISRPGLIPGTGSFAPHGCLPGEPPKQENDRPPWAHVITPGWSEYQ